MSRLQLLRLLISDRLTAAANEIFGAVERAITEYEEELCRSKLEISHQQRPPEVVLKHEVQLDHTEGSQLSVCETELPLDPQQCESAWSPESFYSRHPGAVVQEDRQPTQVKQEHEEPWSGQDQESLQGPVDVATKNFTFTSTSAPTRAYRDLAQFQSRDEENIDDDDDDPLPSTSAEHAKGYSDPTGKRKTLTQGCPVAQSNRGPRSGSKKLKELRMSKGLEMLRRTPAATNGFPKVLELHQKSQAEGQRTDKSYRCNVCGLEFSHSAHLVTHSRIHTGQRLYICKVCGKEFRHGHSVIVHMRIHQEEKPYRCQLCGKQFRQVGNLNVHMRVHTGERPFCCKICGRKFSRNNLMRNHMAMHTGDKLFVTSRRKGSVGMHA